MKQSFMNNWVTMSSSSLSLSKCLFTLSISIALVTVILLWSDNITHAQAQALNNNNNHNNNNNNDNGKNPIVFDKKSPLFQNLPDCRKNFVRIEKQTKAKGTIALHCILLKLD